MAPRRNTPRGTNLPLETQSQTLRPESSALSSVEGSAWEEPGAEEQRMQGGSGGGAVTAEPENIALDIMNMDEEQLNQSIATARVQHRLRRKRQYLDAILKGENPNIDPLEFDEPEPQRARCNDSPSHRGRREGLSLMKLQPLKYRGGTYASLQNFLFELEARFLRYREGLDSDSDRIIYAGSSLEGPIKTRWTNYVKIQHNGILSTVSWDEMKNWLEDSVSDADTRSLESVSRLRRLNQREDQSFSQFLDYYEAIESELPYELPAKYRVCTMLDALRPDLKKQIVSMGIPAGRQELISAARRAESLLRNGQNPQYSRQRAERQQEGTGEGPASEQRARNPPPQNQSGEQQPEGPPAGRWNTGRPSAPVCFKCRQPGHYANVCPQLQNTTSQGNRPGTGANTTPQVRRVERE
jgi:hypothetical protein